MPETNETPSATVPPQREPVGPVKKSTPVLIALIVIVALIGIANISSLVGGKEEIRAAQCVADAASDCKPTTGDELRDSATDAGAQGCGRMQRRQMLAAEMQQLEQQQAVPGPEADGMPRMSVAQREAIYGDSPNAPRQTSNVSQAQAEAKQKALEREKLHQDALNSDTVAVDFSHSSPAPPGISPPAVLADREEALSRVSSETPATVRPADAQKPKSSAKADPLSPYDFDGYQGKLYRVFEGTVFEGVVTNHIDGGLAGPILIMLTTDYYSHDHQQLLMPQGTRLIGTVQSVGNAEQRKMFVTFHRAVCPDGFSIELDKYVGLDPIGTTGLATKVDHGYLQAFAAAAIVGGLGGLAQIGNDGNVLSPSTQIRNGISSQSATEAEQILNHFLNRLPVITLKEGSRARVYIGTDILIPSYAEHRVDPTL